MPFGNANGLPFGDEEGGGTVELLALQDESENPFSTEDGQTIFVE